jgi:serine/threonine protein phosphatase PrpC
VNGQLLRVDLHTGTAVIVNGAVRRAARQDLRRVHPFPLQPGDRIILLTDGMQERNAASLDVAAALADTADLHPREVVHALGAAVLHATGGDLRDDATMVCLDWYGGPPRGRNTEQGADPDRASTSA